MKPFKIAIVGAGICGLYLAWKLAEKGHSVTIFEKKEKIGKEACSGLFSERILSFVPESKKLIQNQINFVLVHFPRRTVKVNFSKKFFVMSHAELDRLVADLVIKAGAQIKLNYDITRNDLVTSFDRVIGCDGALSKVRKILKLKDPNFRLAMQKFVTQKDFSNWVEVWPMPGGFSWKIPRGKNTEYGAITPIKNNQNYRAIQCDSFSLVPQGLIIPKNKRITLCGDAAGLTKPWSGGGVIWGLTAAEILLKNFPDFLAYRKAVRKFFLPKIIFSKTVTRTFYFLGFKAPWILPKKLTIEEDYLL